MVWGWGLLEWESWATERTSILLGLGARAVTYSGREWSLRAVLWAVITVSHR